MYSLEECNYCRIRSDKLKKCGKCRSVAYCSPEHQMLDWKDSGHKLMCNKLAREKTDSYRRRKSYREFITSISNNDSSSTIDVMYVILELFLCSRQLNNISYRFYALL